MQHAQPCCPAVLPTHSCTGCLCDAACISHTHAPPPVQVLMLHNMQKLYVSLAGVAHPLDPPRGPVDQRMLRAGSAVAASAADHGCHICLPGGGGTGRCKGCSCRLHPAAQQSPCVAEHGVGGSGSWSRGASVSCAACLNPGESLAPYRVQCRVHTQLLEVKRRAAAHLHLVIEQHLVRRLLRSRFDA
jgi:hypothetical protein